MRDRENVLIPQIVSSQGEMFREYTLQGRVDAAIALLREHATDAPYFGGFSGGKDSIVIKIVSMSTAIAAYTHQPNVDDIQSLRHENQWLCERIDPSLLQGEAAE
jgi:hypothetical protein